MDGLKIDVCEGRDFVVLSFDCVVSFFRYGRYSMSFSLKIIRFIYSWILLRVDLGVNNVKENIFVLGDSMWLLIIGIYY